MDFAPNKTLVDATIGHPHVVTMGVREQVVKPATKFTGTFAMSYITHSPAERSPAGSRCLPRRFFCAVILAIGLLFLGFAPSHAGSAAAQFRVLVQVIKSCKVSADAIASQAASSNGTIKVNCQNRAAPVSPSGGANEIGGAIPSGTANVNYSVDDVPGSDGGIKLITVNF
jgi:hypothetical protein